MAILIYNKIDFQPKVIKRNGERHFINIKGKIHQDVSVLNIYAPEARPLTILTEKITKSYKTHQPLHNNSERLQTTLLQMNMSSGQRLNR